jgi:hypothetical protein
LLREEQDSEGQFTETRVQLLELAAEPRGAIASAASDAGKKFGSSPANINQYGTFLVVLNLIQIGWINLSASGEPYTAALSSADSAAVETRTSPIVPDRARATYAASLRESARRRSCRRRKRQPPRQ